MGAVCTDVLKSAGDEFDIPGFSKAEVTRTLCRASDYIADEDILSALRKARTTLWPNLSKSVLGGLHHVISSDNAAAYVELWGDPQGNWYAVTNADFDRGARMTKADIVKSSPSIAYFEVPGIYKGDSLERATSRFLSVIYPPKLLKSAGCGCRAANRIPSPV